MSSVGLLSQLDVLQLDPVPSFLSLFVPASTQRQAPHAPPSQGVSCGENISAPSALGISPHTPQQDPCVCSWSGRAEGGVGRAVNHLCFLLISRAARDQFASS